MLKIKLIPVIDLKDGIVVHAQYGDRENYQPIKSVLTTQTDIYSIIHGFLQLHSFDTLYIADLNAITGRGDNSHLIKHALAYFQTIIFWVDTGYQKVGFFPSNYVPVLGSECFTDKNFHEIAGFNKRFILSLDFGMNDKPLGSQKFFTQTHFWSENVILMTLNRVGSFQGTHLNLLKHYKTAYPHTHFIAAGGVRNLEDLTQLENVGIYHVLLASAFHSGAITSHYFTKYEP